MVTLDDFESASSGSSSEVFASDDAVARNIETRLITGVNSGGSLMVMEASVATRKPPTMYERFKTMVTGQATLFVKESTPSTAVDPSSYSGRCLPHNYIDCHLESEKIAWLKSDRGQLIIKKRPVLNELYQNGKLFRLVGDRHWEQRLQQWLADGPPPFAMNLQKPISEDRQTMFLPGSHPLQGHVSSHYRSRILPPVQFPQSSKFDLLTNGYCVFPGLIPQTVVALAEQAINNLLVTSPGFSSSSNEKIARKQDPFFETAGTNEIAVLDMFYTTPLYCLVDALLHGEQKTQQSGENTKEKQIHMFAGGAQIAYRFSQARPVFSRSELSGTSWHIDGMDKGTFGSFALLVGIALSDQLTEFCGNLCVHPGSHYALRSYMKEYAMTVINNNDKIEYHDPKREVAERLLKNRPDLGPPLQLQLRKGDVVLVLHKVAHLGGMYIKISKAYVC